jgi:S1-C subfamily serine protease
MPKVVCGCGAAFPLSEAEARCYAGKVFVCPKCAEMQPKQVKAKTPVPPRISTAPKPSPQPSHSTRKPEVSPPLPPPFAKRDAKDPTAERLKIVVQSNSSFLDQCLKAFAILALIVLSAFGGWYVFKSGIDREVAAVVDDVKQQLQGPKQEVLPFHGNQPIQIEERVANPVKPTNVAARVLPGVATIMSDIANGSGFFIGDQRTIVTSQHVLGGAKTARVVLANREEIKIEGWLAMSRGRDLVIVRLARSAEDAAILELRSNNPQIGDRVLTCGAPQGLSGSISEGIVSAVRDGNELREMMKEATGTDFYVESLGYNLDSTWIQTTAPISQGNSGGPLVDENGRVAGLMTWRIKNGQNLSFAIAARHIRDMLESSDGKLKPFSSLPRIEEIPRP